MNVEFVDNSEAVLEEMEAAALRALETCGLIAEGYAVDLAPVAEEYGGTLRGSITHTVDEQKKTAYIGTNVEYAPYVELGTGKYYPGGRPTPWVYQDKMGCSGPRPGIPRCNRDRNETGVKRNPSSHDGKAVAF